MTQYNHQTEHQIAQIEAAMNGCILGMEQLALIDLRVRQAMARTRLVDGALTPVREHTNVVRVVLSDSIAQLRRLLELTASDVAKHYAPDADAS